MPVRRHTALYLLPPRRHCGEDERKAHRPGQGRVFDQIPAELSHRRHLLIDFHQTGGQKRRVGERGDWRWLDAVAAGHPFPGERAEEAQIAHGDRRVLHPERQLFWVNSQVEQWGPVPFDVLGEQPVAHSGLPVDETRKNGQCFHTRDSFPG